MNLDWDRIRKRRLYLAAPLYANQLHFGFHVSVCNLIMLCLKNRVKMGQKYIGCDSLVPRARNRITAHFLKSDCTDLLFVDSDIKFDPEDALSLLQYDEPIIGGVYPRKQHDWERIRRAAQAGATTAELPGHGFIGVMNWAGEGEYSLSELAKVKHLGTGFLRVRREVFDTIVSKIGDSISYDYAAEQGNFAGKVGYDFFPCGPDVRYPLGSGGRQYLSEDWAFCEMAKQCGFELYAAPWIKLVHSGYCDFYGDLSVMDAAIEEELNATTQKEFVADEIGTIP